MTVPLVPINKNKKSFVVGTIDSEVSSTPDTEGKVFTTFRLASTQWPPATDTSLLTRGDLCYYTVLVTNPLASAVLEDFTKDDFVHVMGTLSNTNFTTFVNNDLQNVWSIEKVDGIGQDDPHWDPATGQGWEPKRAAQEDADFDRVLSEGETN